MKRKLLVSLLCLTFSVCVMACGNKENSTEPTEVGNTTEVVETTECEVDENSTEMISEEVSAETESVNDEDNNTEIEVNDEGMTEENQITSSAMGSVNREDFVIVDASWGYSNLVDYVEATGDRMASAVIGYHSVYNNGQIDGNYGEDAVTNKGIRLGSTREEVVKAYGKNGYDGPTNDEVYKIEGHYGVTMLQLEYLESPTHHYYLYFVFDENDILVGMATSCWIER